MNYFRRIVTLSALLLAVSLLTACNSKPSSNAAEMEYFNGCVFKSFGKMEEAVECFQKAAEQGHAEAQCALANCYLNGEGVEKDYAEAVKWCRKAAEQGDALAQVLLGDCYMNGDGVSQDKSEAVKWWRKAAEQGNEKAQ